MLLMKLLLIILLLLLLLMLLLLARSSVPGKSILLRDRVQTGASPQGGLGSKLGRPMKMCPKRVAKMHGCVCW